MAVVHRNDSTSFEPYTLDIIHNKAEESDIQKSYVFIDFCNIHRERKKSDHCYKQAHTLSAPLASAKS